MTAALPMSDQPTLWDTPNAISSPASAAGPTPSDSPAGLTTGMGGRGVALVSLFLEPARLSVMRMRATCGLSSFVSLPSVALQRSLESRLRVRLAGTGSPLYVLTWKHWAMPWGEPISALRASAPRTSGNACGGWPTPNAGPQNDGDTTWEARRENLKLKHGNGNGFGMVLGQAAQLAGWPTTKATDGEKGARSHRGAEKELKRKGPGSDLPTIAMAAGRATPTVQDSANNAGPSQFRRNTLPLNCEATLVTSGPPSTGSPAEMANTGQLNPAFSRWLMGYPPAWCDCAVTAMQSMSTRRRRS